MRKCLLVSPVGYRKHRSGRRSFAAAREAGPPRAARVVVGREALQQLEPLTRCDRPPMPSAWNGSRAAQCRRERTRGSSLGAAERADGLVDRAEAAVGADRLQEAGAPGGLEDGLPYLSERELHPCRPQSFAQLGELLGARDVEAGVRAGVEDHGPRCRFAGPDESLDGVADERGVGVEERCLQSEDQQPRHLRVRRVAPDVAVGVGDVRDVPEHGDVRPARVVDDQEDHRDHADHEPGQHVDCQDAGERPEPDPELEPPLGVVLPELVDLPEVGDRVDDQRGEHRLGQVLEERREDEHRHEREHGRDEWRDLGPGAGSLVDGRLRQAAAAGEAAEEAGAGIRDAERDQLLVGVDLVAVLGRKILGRPERLAEDHDQQPAGTRDQRCDVAGRRMRDRR